MLKKRSALIKYVVMALSLLILASALLLGWLVGTTSGLNGLISLSNRFLGDSVFIKLNPKKGSVLSGFETDEPFLVEVAGIVKVSGDNFLISYDGMGYLARNLLKVSAIRSQNLQVALYDLKDDAQSGKEEDPPVAGDEPFRLNFPSRIVIDKLNLDKFAYLSSIVDVNIGSACLSLEAFDNYAGVKKGVIADAKVTLKHELTDGKTAKTPTHQKSSGAEIMSFGDNDGLIEQLAEVDLPLDAQLQDLSIKRGIFSMDGFSTGFFNADLSAFWHRRLLEVEKLGIDHSLGLVRAFGTMDFRNFYNMDFTLEGSGYRNEETRNLFQGALYGLSGQAKLTGDLVGLNLEVSTFLPKQLHLEAKLNALSPQLPLKLELNSKLLEYPLLKPQKNTRVLAGDSSATEAYALKASEKSDANKAGKVTTPKVAAAISDDDKTLAAENLRLKLNGAIFKNLDADLSFMFSGYGFNKSQTSLKGKLSLDDFKIERFETKGKFGKDSILAVLSGSLSWRPQLAFDGGVDLKVGDAGAYDRALKGPMSLSSKLGFSFDYDQDETFDTVKRDDAKPLPLAGLFVFVDTLDSSLTLNGKKAVINIKGLSGGTKNGFEIEQINFTQDQNHLNLQGSLSDDSLLKGSFAFKNLTDLYADIQGELSGQLQVIGDFQKPKVNLIARSKRIAYGNIRVRNLVLNDRVDFDNEDFSLTFFSDSLHLGGILKPYRKCSLDLSGRLASHDLTVACGQGQGSYVRASGSYDEKQSLYKAVLNNFILFSDIIDPVSLKKPVNFEYSLAKSSGFVSGAELTDGVAALQIGRTDINAEGFQTSLSLNGFDTSKLQKYLPEGAYISGNISLKAQGGVKSGSPMLSASVVSEQSGAAFSNFVFSFKKLGIDAELSGGSLSTSVNAELNHNGGVLKLDAAVSDLYASKEFSGWVSLKDFDLSLLTAGTEVFNEMKGVANVSGSLGGNLANPQFKGVINLKGSAEPHYNVGSVDGFNFTVNASGSSGVLSGTIVVNKSGRILVGGDLDWSKGAYGHLTLDADNLPILLAGYGDALLNIHSAAELDDGVDIKGSVLMPKANIVVNSLSQSGIAPSKDEIYIEQGGLRDVIKEHKFKSPPIKTSLDIDFDLGNDVKLDAMGLKAEVIGGIKLYKTVFDKDLKARGTVSLVNGKADLYGHKFIVNKADTVFRNKVMEPMIDAEVVADPEAIEDDVVAGVRVTGAASDPNISLFSNPAMSQSEILSYLLYGHGLEKSTGDADGNYSSQLMMSLGLGTTAGIINSVANVFGMDGLQVGSSGSGDETQLEVQSYITKNIRLSYGYGIFTSISEFKLRYELMRRLYAEFVSSLDQSVDLIYSFEFD